MAKFLLLAHGKVEGTPAFQEAHQRWWSAMQGHVADPGSPLVNGLNVTTNGRVSELNEAADPARGYTIIEAESREAALALLADSPMDLWVYEAAPM